MFELIQDWIEQKVRKWQPIEPDSEPALGAVIYTDLLFGAGEHSGIYVGNKQVVALHGDGQIKKVSLRTFTNHLSYSRDEIYVPYDSEINWSIGSYVAYSRALEAIGENRSYHLLLNNCHQFAAGCVTGDFDNDANFLWILKDIVEDHHESVIWRKWNWNG